MSTLSDAMAALKNVVLMQERLEVARREVESLARGVDGLKDYIAAVDKRVIRIEAFIEMSGRQAPPQARIEEQ